MRDIITLLEEKSKPQDIEIIPLNFTPNEVSPVLSKDTLDLHYGKLAHGYAERYNNKEGDMDFNYAGAFLHNTLFQDLLVKDEKKNLVKGSSGQWQVQPDKLPELKNRLAKEYGLSANSILDYNEYMAKRKSIPAGMKYNVIVAPGEGDISANDPNIISTLLLKH